MRNAVSPAEMFPRIREPCLSARVQRAGPWLPAEIAYLGRVDFLVGATDRDRLAPIRNLDGRLDEHLVALSSG